MIKVSVQDAVNDLRREFVDLTNGEFNKGVARALNRTIQRSKTTSSKEIRQIYNILARDVNQTLSLRRASPSTLTSELRAEGALLSLRKFSPRQTTDGVSIMIKKGNRQIIKGAFISPSPKLNGGVFARGTYSGKDFNFRHKRIRSAGGYKKIGGRYQPTTNDLSIDSLKTLSVPQAIAHRAVLNALSLQMSEDFPKRLVHELRWVRQKG
jgi:hypothetical protein